MGMAPRKRARYSDGPSFNEQFFLKSNHFFQTFFFVLLGFGRLNYIRFDWTMAIFPSEIHGGLFRFSVGDCQFRRLNGQLYHIQIFIICSIYLHSTLVSSWSSNLNLLRWSLNKVLILKFPIEVIIVEEKKIFWGIWRPEFKIQFNLHLIRSFLFHGLELGPYFPINAINVRTLLCFCWYKNDWNQILNCHNGYFENFKQKPANKAFSRAF